MLCCYNYLRMPWSGNLIVTTHCLFGMQFIAPLYNYGNKYLFVKREIFVLVQHNLALQCGINNSAKCLNAKAKTIYSLTRLHQKTWEQEIRRDHNSNPIQRHSHVLFAGSSRRFSRPIPYIYMYMQNV